MNFETEQTFFSFLLGNQCWNHLCLIRHFWFVPKREKKCVSKDIFCSPTTIVDDNNNKHRCRQCPSSPEHCPKVRTTYTHSYKVTACCLLLLLRVVATKVKTLMPISAFGDEVSPKSIGIKVNTEHWNHLTIAEKICPQLLILSKLICKDSKRPFPHLLIGLDNKLNSTRLFIACVAGGIV